MEQMDAMIRRMDRVHERIHQLDQTLLRQMDRIRDQERLQQHQRLREMWGATGTMAREVQRNMERTRELLRDPAFQRDQEMQRDMDRLRQHWEDMAGRMEEGVGILERLQGRLGPPDGP